MRFLSRKFILALFLFSSVPGAVAQDLPSSSQLDDAISGCWDALTPAHTAVFCINHDLVTASYFYPNSKVKGDENICQQLGEIKYTSPTTMNMSFLQGDCLGNKIFPSNQMDCEKSDQTFVCTVTDVDLPDPSALDVPPLKFEPIGRDLQER